MSLIVELSKTKSAPKNTIVLSFSPRTPLSNGLYLNIRAPHINMRIIAEILFNIIGINDATKTTKNMYIVNNIATVANNRILFPVNNPPNIFMKENREYI